MVAVALILVMVAAAGAAAADVRINQIQFVGSHNSYKKAMHPADMDQLQARNPQAAIALDYEHLPLHEQLDLGMRVLEIDLFYSKADGQFIVGHVQQIDMNSHCDDLVDCLNQIRTWSARQPQHIPIWLMFNLKDQKIDGLPDPEPFTLEALTQLNDLFTRELGDQLIWPHTVIARQWPELQEARGRFLLLLDEGGKKRDDYLQVDAPAMFANLPPEHPRSAVLVMNEPVAQERQIRALVEQGYMVRTRADADTVEARSGDTARRTAAFASGAQAVSTDYYLPAQHFGTSYQVRIDSVVRCNPVSAPSDCQLAEVVK